MSNTINHEETKSRPSYAMSIKSSNDLKGTKASRKCFFCDQTKNVKLVGYMTDGEEIYACDKCYEENVDIITDGNKELVKHKQQETMLKYGYIIPTGITTSTACFSGTMVSQNAGALWGMVDPNSYTTGTNWATPVYTNNVQPQAINNGSTAIPKDFLVPYYDQKSGHVYIPYTNIVSRPPHQDWVLRHELQSKKHLLENKTFSNFDSFIKYVKDELAIMVFLQPTTFHWETPNFVIISVDHDIIANYRSY